MKMHKNCNGCKALNDYSCDLMYMQQIITGGDWHGGIESIRPDEPCPKPKSKKEFETYRDPKTYVFLGGENV